MVRPMKPSLRWAKPGRAKPGFGCHALGATGLLVLSLLLLCWFTGRSSHSLVHDEWFLGSVRGTRVLSWASFLWLGVWVPGRLFDWQALGGRRALAGGGTAHAVVAVTAPPLLTTIVAWVARMRGGDGAASRQHAACVGACHAAARAPRPSARWARGGSPGSSTAARPRTQARLSAAVRATSRP